MLILPRPPARPAMRDGRDEALVFDRTVTWIWASLGLGLFLLIFFGQSLDLFSILCRA